MVIDGKENFGRFYDKFKVGDVYKHWPGKTITESDNNLFCLLTMNHHPVHLDEKFARRSQHKKILVVGTLVLSLAVGLSVRDTSGKAIANLEYSDVIHHLPVFVGDTIYTETEILKKRISKSNSSRGTISLETRAYNQHNKKVLTLRRKILVPKNE